LLPLFDGLAEDPPWTGFVRNLAERTRAHRAVLAVTLASAAPSQPPVLVHGEAGERLDMARLRTLGLHPSGGMRPGRVYALHEMLDHDRPAIRDEQRAALAGMGAEHGRWMRVSAGGAADALFVLARAGADFSAAATAALSATAAPFAGALRAFAALAEQRLLAALAQRGSERAGAARIAFDVQARVIAADPAAEAMLSFLPDAGPRPGRRLRLLPEPARALERACAEMAGDADAPPRLLRLDARGSLALLLRASDLLPMGPVARPAAVGTLALPGREDARGAARVLSALYGLSAREASLAHGLTLGETIAEAGQRLTLTPETARNYSKRIYAKTGARGQADLVRMLLTGLARHA
jgi:DNA-binding CsgD family transcriptional regulator/PAS domain-containing protein